MRRVHLAVFISLLLIPGSVLAFRAGAFDQMARTLEEYLSPVVVAEYASPPTPTAFASASPVEPASTVAEAASQKIPAANTEPVSNKFFAQLPAGTDANASPLPSDDLVHTSLLAAALAAFESKIDAQISTITKPPAFPQEVAAGGNGIFSYGAAAAASSYVPSAVPAAPATFSALSGSLNLASQVSGTLGIGNGGTGLVSAPAYGQLLVGAGDGTFTLISTSSLGITGGAGSGTVSNGTQGQFAFYNTAGTTLTATSSLFLAQNGFLGIGTTTPATLLDVEGTGSLVSIGGAGIVPSVVTISNTSGVNPLEIHTANAQGVNLYTHSDTGFRAPVISLFRSRGTQSSPGAVQSGDLLGYLTIGGGYNGSAYTGAAQIQVSANENWNTSANGAKITFYAASAGGTGMGQSMTINNQNVGISDSSPGARLSVVGNAQIGYSSGQTAPSNGLIVNGNVGIGTTTPWARLSIDTSNLAAGVPEFAIGSSTRQDFIVTQNGNVGIGTTSPGTTLEISGNYVTGKGSLYINPSAGQNGYLSINADSNKETGIQFRSAGSTKWWLYRTTDGLNDFRIASFDVGDLLAVKESTGNVGIGTTSPDVLLTVGSNSPSGSVAHFENSTGSCYINPTTTSLSCSSDARLKTNVVPLDSADGLAAVLKLNPVTYNWKTEPATTSPHTGFIAQDVQPVLPDLVSRGPDGYYTLNYAGLTPYLVKAIQEIASISGTFKANLTTFLGSAGNGLTDLFAGTGHFSDKLCIGSGASVTCVNQQQLAAILSQSAASTLPTSVTSSGPPQASNSRSSGDGNSTTTTVSIPPVISVNGANPTTISIGTAYADLGATITAPLADVNLDLTVVVDNATSTNGTAQIDTSLPGTHTILYTVTDPSGLTGSATRRVIVSAPQHPPVAANDNTPAAANDNTASSTTATSTAQ